MQPDTPPASAPTLIPKARRRWPLLVLAVAVIVVAAVVSVYVLTPHVPPPIPLTIRYGSTTGTVPWNMTTGSNQKDLVLDFKATTYANESDGEASVLAMRVYLYALFDSACGCIAIRFNVTATGAFASDLRPTGLELRADLAGPNATRDVTLYGAAGLTGTNISFASNQYTYTVNGSITATATILPQTGLVYNFSLSDPFQFNAPPAYNRTLGFRATVDGPFVPSVSVGVVLAVIYAPG